MNDQEPLIGVDPEFRLRRLELKEKARRREGLWYCELCSLFCALAQVCPICGAGDTMTAPKSVWCTIESSFELHPAVEYDAFPATPYPPFSETYPFDGMIVCEDRGKGRSFARFYHRYVGDEWVEIRSAEPGEEWEFLPRGALRLEAVPGGDD